MSWVVVVQQHGGEPLVAGPYRAEGRAFAALESIRATLPEEGFVATLVPCLPAEAWTTLLVPRPSTGLSPAVDAAL